MKFTVFFFFHLLKRGWEGLGEKVCRGESCRIYIYPCMYTIFFFFLSFNMQGPLVYTFSEGKLPTDSRLFSI